MMLDTDLGEPVRVLNDEATGPYIEVSVNQLELVRRLLTDHGVRFWVTHQAISVQGGPFTTTIYIRKGTDPARIQALLDQAA